MRLVQHLGLDYRGVPMETARERGIPVAATPLVNYAAVAEHVWALILADLKRLADQRDYMSSRGYQRSELRCCASHGGTPSDGEGARSSRAPATAKAPASATGSKLPPRWLSSKLESSRSIQVVS